MAGQPKQRVFIHYVLGKMLLLFFLCHPGTLACIDSQAYLLNRYANRDLVTSESEMEDHRRHYTPRDASEFTMKTGVPDEILHGDANGTYTPDWAPSLEERFHNTVKAWLRKGCSLANKQQVAVGAGAGAGAVAPRPVTTAGGTAFVSTLPLRRAVAVHQGTPDFHAKHTWTSLSEVGADPRRLDTAVRAYRPPARVHRRSPWGPCSCGGVAGGGMRSARGRDSSMLLGRFRRGGFSLRQGGAGGESESKSKVDGSNNGASADGVEFGDARVPAPAMMAAAAQSKKATAAAIGRSSAAVTKAKLEAKAAKATSESLEDPEVAAPPSMLSSFFGGAADAYDNALSFVGSTLIRSEIGRKYMSGYDSGPTSIRRTGGGATDIYNTGSTYDLVGFSNIDPYEASARRGRGNSYRL